jgi:hypothetical protein
MILHPMFNDFEYVVEYSNYEEKVEKISDIKQEYVIICYGLTQQRTLVC